MFLLKQTVEQKKDQGGIEMNRNYSNRSTSACLDITNSILNKMVRLVK